MSDSEFIATKALEDYGVEIRNNKPGVLDC